MFKGIKTLLRPYCEVAKEKYEGRDALVCLNFDAQAQPWEAYGRGPRGVSREVRNKGQSSSSASPAEGKLAMRIPMERAGTNPLELIPEAEQDLAARRDAGKDIVGNGQTCNSIWLQEQYRPLTLISIVTMVRWAKHKGTGSQVPDARRRFPRSEG
eukprot:3668295-Amphidinium_carterae.1